MGATLQRVAIVALRDQTYFAELHVVVRSETVVVSARPSDAVALAVRAQCEIEIDSDLLDQLEAEGTTVEWNDEVDDDEDDETPEEIVDEFREFLEGLNPEDFA